jgi:hypothetical protein
MFIIEPIKKEEATGELKLFYRMAQRALGFVPPHFEVFATIDLPSMQAFMQLNQYMMTHPKIKRELLPFLRLYIAKKECRGYCTNFNTQMLLGMDIDKEIVDNIETSVGAIPLEKSQVMLLQKVLDALEDAQSFGQGDLEELYAQGFSDKDFFDLLNYACEFNAKSKMIEIYLKND